MQYLYLHSVFGLADCLKLGVKQFSFSSTREKDRKKKNKDNALAWPGLCWRGSPFASTGVGVCCESSVATTKDLSSMTSRTFVSKLRKLMPVMTSQNYSESDALLESDYSTLAQVKTKKRSILNFCHLLPSTRPKANLFHGGHLLPALLILHVGLCQVFVHNALKRPRSATKWKLWKDILEISIHKWTMLEIFWRKKDLKDLKHLLSPLTAKTKHAALTRAPAPTASCARQFANLALLPPLGLGNHLHQIAYIKSKNYQKSALKNLSKSQKPDIA